MTFGAWQPSCAAWACAALLGLALSAAVLAEPAAPGSGSGRAWSSLSAAQRTSLAPLERDWPQLDASRQQKWLDIAARLPAMPPDERERMQQRMNDWARRSPEERGQARLNYQQARQLSPEERQSRWEAYQALPPEQRRELAGRAAPQRAAAVPVERAGPKSNLVRAQPTPSTGKAVAPTVVQAAPGATTTLVTRPAKPPLHQQAGMPKIAATPGFVDATTLLPQRGAQAAATRAPLPAPSAATRVPLPAPSAATRAPLPAPSAATRAASPPAASPARQP